MHKWPKN